MTIVSAAFAAVPSPSVLAAFRLSADSDSGARFASELSGWTAASADADAWRPAAPADPRNTAESAAPGSQTAAPTASAQTVVQPTLPFEIELPYESLANTLAPRDAESGFAKQAGQVPVASTSTGTALTALAIVPNRAEVYIVPAAPAAAQTTLPTTTQVPSNKAAGDTESPAVTPRAATLPNATSTTWNLPRATTSPRHLASNQAIRNQSPVQTESGRQTSSPTATQEATVSASPVRKAETAATLPVVPTDPADGMELVDTAAASAPSAASAAPQMQTDGGAQVTTGAWHYQALAAKLQSTLPRDVQLSNDGAAHATAAQANTQQAAEAQNVTGVTWSQPVTVTSQPHSVSRRAIQGQQPARTESGGQTLSREPIQMATVTAQVAAALGPVAGDPAIGEGATVPAEPTVARNAADETATLSTATAPASESAPPPREGPAAAHFQSAQSGTGKQSASQFAGVSLVSVNAVPTSTHAWHSAESALRQTASASLPPTVPTMAQPDAFPSPSDSGMANAAAAAPTGASSVSPTLPSQTAPMTTPTYQFQSTYQRPADTAVASSVSSATLRCFSSRKCST